MTDALAQLAQLHGIALDYRDVWGNSHPIAHTTLRELLAAIGVEARDDAAVEASLDADRRQRGADACPSSVVLREGAPAQIGIVPPLGVTAQSLRWQLVEEHGEESEGEFATPTADTDAASSSGGPITVVLPRPPGFGYHSLTVRAGDAIIGQTTLIVAPTRCYMPPALAGGRKIWGAAAQLYAIRSQRNWGIGDFTDLAAMLQQWKEVGADIVGVNPLHALFPHNPAHLSPYSPSSRLFLNTLYLDVEAIVDYGESEAARALVATAEFRQELDRLRAAEFVDYIGVARAKSSVLILLHEHFRAIHLSLGSDRAKAFTAFCEAGGVALQRQALFEALQEHFHQLDGSVWGWPVWPEPFRDPASNEVARFATEHSDRVQYYLYLQWQSDLQLATVAKRALRVGLAVGLYVDLAVSIDRAGAESWSNQRLYAVQASVGAPPDEYNMRGQNWGLPPLAPARLRDAQYAPFIATLRANMRHARALRIDHIMGLLRLYWIPPGAEPSGGSYVQYPLDDLLAILALESQRHRCLIIGEDLGTVPDALRVALFDAGVLSYRLLYFERAHGGEFSPPSAYPAQAIVAASTHDLPTLTGWWEGRDLAVRTDLGLFPSDQSRYDALDERGRDRARLLRALAREQLLPPGVSEDPQSAPTMTPELTLAVHVFLGRTPSQVLVVQLEDVIGMSDQANLPATVDSHPNWRRKISLPLEQWPTDARFTTLSRALAMQRPTPSPKRVRADGNATAPLATYRLQLHHQFTFADATRLVPYLSALGISHVYCSPYLRARAGSEHGYDIVDHQALNPELGTSADYERFSAELARHGMGQLFDMVPNHMGIMGGDNAWWLDVLENGEASVYAGYFDIDWNPIDPDLRGKVLVPVLGDHYGRALEKHELELAFQAPTGAFFVRYYEHRMPIDPREYAPILDRALNLAGDALAGAAGAELASLSASFRKLPSRDSADPDAIAERHRDKELHKGRLARLVGDHPGVASAIRLATAHFNTGAEGQTSVADLDALLEAQPYRLVYWRAAADEINYRRFFDINALAALRMEQPGAFEATHHLALELAATGKVDGLRIDHPDGLADPAAYFERVQSRYAELTGQDSRNIRLPLYMTVEKIEATHERLPTDWRVQGTTGYRFASLVQGLFIDAVAMPRIDRTWRAFVGEEAMDFADAAYRGKREIMRTALSAELAVLANRLLRIARADRRTRDLTLSSLRNALAEIAASFPVYRTYVAQTVSVQDRRYIDWAVSVARKRSRTADASVFDFVRNVLLVEPPEGAPHDAEGTYRSFAMRFQQFTAPVTAKGVEDTSFYLFNRLISLNDVGGDPDKFGTTVKAFHRANEERLLAWPDTMLAGSTHDNKRASDVRARINVISEMPAMWRLQVRRWSRVNRSRKRVVADKTAPSRNDEYLLYQTLVGSFPVDAMDTDGSAAYRERIVRYMIKAAREAKVNTSWIAVNDEYESALRDFVSAILDDSSTNPFVGDLKASNTAFAWFGALNSIARVALHFTVPGVPDIYQGDEIMDLSLVDPDNRRPVDYRLRSEMLRSLEAGLPADAATRTQQVQSMLARPHDGRLKLWVTWQALRLRKTQPELLARGDYVPISVSGDRAAHVVAFARRLGNQLIVVASGRLFAQLDLTVGEPPTGARAWTDAALDVSFLPSGTRLKDVLTGEVYAPSEGRLSVASVFAQLPVALISVEPDGAP
jgi:(1->4)-alpha-D-glucan 1-alpha-D-glucosylmutase